MGARSALPVGAILAALLLVATSAAAQEVELFYDDGAGGATLRDLAAGDVEFTRMTPEHPARLLSVRLQFATAGCTARIAVWGDNGGNAADLARVLFETDVEVAEPGWVEVAVPEGAVVLDPPQHFYVGHVVPDPPCQLSWDRSGSPEARSMARMGGTLYSIIDGSDPPQYIDAMIRATVAYFDVRDTFDFEEVTDDAGVPGNMSRMAWGDYDGDGDDDLLVNGRQLFRNEGDGAFTDVTEEAGIGETGTNGGLWADYDNDGHLDFYATLSSYHPECAGDGDCVYCTLQSLPDGTRTCLEEQHDHTCVEGRCMPPSEERRHDLLWHNEGDGTFVEVSEAAGPYDFLPTQAAGWGDYDGDGFVDLYVANYETPGQWVGGALSVGTPDHLWRNEGDGTFTDATVDAGLEQTALRFCGRGVAWADHDQDGDLDLYVANYRLHLNLFYDNLGDGSFEFISYDNGTGGVEISDAFGHSIGASWADYDLDGDWDLFVANLAHPRFLAFSDLSMLYQSSGPPDFNFTDVREAAGIPFSETHSNPAWGDFDNDGFEDLFLTDVYVGYRSFLYRNVGDGSFADVTYPAGIDVDNGWGAAWADFDGDGRLDLASRGLYRNDADRSGHWLQARLHGVESNAAAIGAVVEVTAGGRTMMRQVAGGMGTGVQNSLVVHFGLGDAAMADEVVVRWPSGQVDRHPPVAADQRVELTEGELLPPPEPDPEPDAGPDAGSDASTAAPMHVRGGGGCRAGPSGGSPGAALLLALALMAGLCRRR